MELLSVAYADLPNLSGGQPTADGQSAYLRLRLSIDPALLAGYQGDSHLWQTLRTAFPLARRGQLDAAEQSISDEAFAHLVCELVLDLQRDLCEWPTASYSRCLRLDAPHEYELYVESIDERVGRFAAQLAVEVIRMLVLNQRFDARLIWVIDLVRQLHRQPRLRLTPRRVASLLGCSRRSAKWAVEELERYGYFQAGEMHRPHRMVGGHVLIVDDNAQIRDILSRILEMLGFDAVTAVDGEEGLILLDWASYQAIFVDMIMPTVDGMTFLQRARVRGVTCPIFAITAYDYRWDPAEIQSQGATDYVRKPFSAIEIESLVRKYLR